MNAMYQAFAQELGSMTKEAAKRSQEDIDEAKFLAGSALAASGLGGLVIGAPVAAALGMSVMGSSMKNQSSVPVKELAAHMGIEEPVQMGYGTYAYASPKNIKDSPEASRQLEGMLGPEDYQKARRAGVILTPTPGKGDVGVYAHELGHAVSAKKNKILSGVQGFARKGAVQGASVIASALMAVAPDDAESLVVSAAPAVPALVQAPILAEEALASLRGYKAIKGIGIKDAKVLKKARGNLIKAFGTYLVGAGIMVAPSAGAVAYRKTQEKKQGK